MKQIESVVETRAQHRRRMPGIFSRAKNYDRIGRLEFLKRSRSSYLERDYSENADNNSHR